MFIVTIILGGILALAFIGAGGSKLAGVPAMREAATHLQIPFSTFRLIGAAEVAGAVGIVAGLLQLGLGSLAVLAAACIVVLMIGAVVVHIRAGDKPAQWAPPATLAVLALVFILLRSAASA